MPSFPSTLECPHCRKTFKQRSFSRTKRTVCVHCGRKFPLWEARFFVLLSVGNLEEVTENMQPKLELMREKYENPMPKPVVIGPELDE